jgi:protocatechuate 3,4-dioxygenase beta subunit
VNARYKATTILKKEVAMSIKKILCIFLYASLLTIPAAQTKLYAAGSAFGWIFSPTSSNCEPCSDVSDTSSIVTLASADEPGQHLIITGTVYKSDGKTPLAGAVMYAYQTDAGGVYSRGTNSSRNPRLKGWLKTRADGRYEIRTIKPGSYPGSRNPAHIHASIIAPSGKEQWIDEFLFDGDPFLKKEDYEKFANKGRFSSILKVQKGKGGVLQAVRDIRVDVP